MGSKVLKRSDETVILYGADASEVCCEGDSKYRPPQALLPSYVRAKTFKEQKE